jgi:hypothetical protein
VPLSERLDDDRYGGFSEFPAPGESGQISIDFGDYGRKRAVSKHSEDGRSIPMERKANAMEGPAW